MAKFFLVFLLGIFFTGATIAQDTIMMRNGDQIMAKIKVVGISEIEYYKADNITGPLHIVAKADVFMVKYQNGSREVFTNSESPAPSQPRAASPEHKWQKPGYEYERLQQMASKRITAGAIITGLGVGMLVTGISLTAIEMNGSVLSSGNVNPERMIGGMFLTLAGIPCSIIGPILLAKGFKYRRRAQELSPTISLGPVINNSELLRYNYTPNQTTVAAVGITF